MQSDIDRNRDAVSARLLAELEQVTFDGHAHVLERTRSSGWRTRLHRLWNAEIELPVVPAALTLIVMIAAAGMLTLGPPKAGEQSDSVIAPRHRDLIEAGGSIYWKDDYDKAVAMLENPDQG